MDILCDEIQQIGGELKRTIINDDNDNNDNNDDNNDDDGHRSIGILKAHL